MSPEPSSTINGLRKDSSNKNNEYMVKFMARFDHVIRSWCRLRLPEQEVEDAVAIVFVQIIKGIKTYNSAAANTFKVWLKSIANNVITDLHRKFQRSVPTVSLFQDESVVDQLAVMIEEEIIQRDYFELSWARIKFDLNPDPVTIELFEKHYLENEAVEDAAKRLGLTTAAAYKRINRFKKLVKTEMQKSVEHEFSR